MIESNHHDTLQNIYSSIKPVYLICKILGLNPLRYNGVTFIEFSKKDWLYFGFYITLYSLLSSYSLVSVITDDDNFVFVSKYVVLTECGVMIALMFVVIILTFFTRQIQVKAFNLLAHIDVSFIKNGFSLQYRPLLKTTYVIVIFMAISLLVRSFLMLSTVHVNVIQQGTLLIAALIKALSKYQFVVFVLQLQMRFTEINNIIKSFYKKDSKITKVVLSPLVRTIPGQLYTLCRLHYKLSSVIEKINIAFAFQLLVSIAVSLFDILFQAYYLYYIFAGKPQFLNLLTIICPIIWLIDETAEIYWLVYACATTCDQANETPTILHELRNNYFDIELESHIQTYSLQMLHQKVQFSVLGFFAIDYTLIYSIVGAVTTYLVIFIQFDQSSNSNLDSEAVNGSIFIN